MRSPRGAALLLAIALAGAALACSGGVSVQSREAAPASPEAVAAVPLAPAAPQPAPIEEAPKEAPPKPRKVVVLDPGHGSDEVGAAANGVVEKDSNLDMALRVEGLLRDRVDVVLTRRTDSRAAPQIAGFTAARSDIQARIDLANAAGADVFVSIHSNGSTDTSQKGVEAWYDSDRPFAGDNFRLARSLLAQVLAELRAYGYPAADRGLFDGRCYRERQGRCFTLFVLGGPRETTREEIVRRGGDPEAVGFSGRPVIFSRPGEMPAALIELLIISNPADAAVLKQEGARDAMARGIATSVLEFLGLVDGGG